MVALKMIVSDELRDAGSRLPNDTDARTWQSSADCRLHGHRIANLREGRSNRVPDGPSTHPRFVCAEQQAELARQQLSIADQRTREANTQRREAAFEREKAERRAKDVRAISAALLD